jgi:hypothetical protein
VKRYPNKRHPEETRKMKRSPELRHPDKHNPDKLKLAKRRPVKPRPDQTRNMKIRPKPGPSSGTTRGSWRSSSPIRTWDLDFESEPRDQV